MMSLTAVSAWAAPARSSRQALPEFPPCGPVTEFAPDVQRAGSPPTQFPLPSLDFCARWNPEFANNGHHCCGKTGLPRRLSRKQTCSKDRRTGRYCSEMTPEQADYSKKAAEGKLGDILQLIVQDLGRKGEQAYCAVNNGFLAHGRRLIPSEKNRVAIRSPERCTDFGTDGMVGMLEWVGRQVASRYSAEDARGVRLLVGDISAPRGGCLAGRSGRRGHLSHTTGQDVDIGFLTANAGKDSPIHFHRSFDVADNWWLIQQIFKNPFACVKVVFLDKRLIRKLAKVASRDAESWKRLGRFVRHMPGHGNHIHVRVGNSPGIPGCVADAHPELETEDMQDEVDAIEAAIGGGSDEETSTGSTEP